jgi:hypothetical protein
MKKMAESPAEWSLLTEGVSAASIEAHRLRLALNRVTQLIEASEEKEKVYQIAGDLIMDVPQRLDKLERHLERLSYALVLSGKSSLKTRLSIEDRNVVEQALETPSASKVAASFLRKADLSPPLGYPGGTCFVTDRIEDKVRQPSERAFLIEKVEDGDDLGNQEAARIYKIEGERGAGLFREMSLSSHVQFRMDLRGITVPEIRLALQSFSKKLSDLKSTRSPMFDFLTKQLMTDAVEWTDPKIGLTIVFRSDGRGSVRLVTTYWKGEVDPGPQTCSRRRG